MTWQFSPYTLISLITALIALAIAGYSWQRKIHGANYFAWLMVAVGEWALCNALEFASVPVPLKIFWSKLSYLGITALAPLWVLFVARYSQRGRWSSEQLAAVLWIVPAITVALNWTTELHGLVWAKIGTVSPEPGSPLVYEYGAVFWAHAIYAYALMLYGTILLVIAALRSPTLYRQQTGMLLAAAIVPWVSNFLYISGLNPFPGLDLTPLAFTVTGLLVLSSIFRHQLLELMPVAYDTLFREMGNGVLVLDGQQRITEANPAAQKMLELQANIIGQKAEQALAAWSELLKLNASASAQEAEIRAQRQETEMWLDARLTPLRDRQGQLSGQLIVLQDITDRKSLESQRLLLETALQAAANGVVISDANGNIRWVNPAFTRLTGYTLEEAIHQNPRILKSGQHSKEYYKNLWDTILAGKVWRGEVINRRKDGTLYTEEMTITPVIQSDGSLTNFIAIKQDITERKRAEEALAEAHQQALEANRLKTQLLTNVSHDLRTPLGAILGFAEMLRAGVFGEATPKQKEAAGEIIDSSNQLMTFVDNLIGQAQFETGKIVLKVKSFDPRELFAPLQATAGTLAKKKGVQLEYEIDEQLPKVLFGDLYWLRQIVANLINNAVKFTDQGAVKVRLHQPDAQHWAIQVADTGIGIPEEDQAAIFEAFRQVDGSTTRRHSGSGLGLAIVQELTSLMDGKIELNSAIGKGSTFTITLPLIRSEENSA